MCEQWPLLLKSMSKNKIARQDLHFLLDFTIFSQHLPISGTITYKNGPSSPVPGNAHFCEVFSECAGYFDDITNFTYIVVLTRQNIISVRLLT